MEHEACLLSYKDSSFPPFVSDGIYSLAIFAFSMAITKSYERFTLQLCQRFQECLLSIKLTLLSAQAKVFEMAGSLLAVDAKGTNTKSAQLRLIEILAHIQGVFQIISFNSASWDVRFYLLATLPTTRLTSFLMICWLCKRLYLL